MLGFGNCEEYQGVSDRARWRDFPGKQLPAAMKQIVTKLRMINNCTFDLLLAACRLFLFSIIFWWPLWA